MILIPFVENAFKHGLTTKQPCEITVAITAHTNRLTLLVENQVFRTLPDGNGNQSGIGLANVMQRLEHAYADRYQLTTSEAAGKHTILLELQLGTT